MDRLEVKASLSVSDAGEITGVAWPFDAPDAAGDVIHKGAFATSAALPILFEHDPEKVVGAWELVAENDDGLQVKGRLFLDSVPRARHLHGRIKAGRLTGLSIGFKAGETKARPGGGRDIHSLHVAEVSIVANPSHPGARILTVKSKESPMPIDNAAPAPEIAELEKKVAAVADVPATLVKLTERFDKFEAKMNRPVAANANAPDGENERKAFRSYLRIGDRADALELKTLTVSNDTQGGYLAPAEVATEFLRELVEFSPMRTIATVRQTAAPSIILPKRNGRTNALWKGEQTATTASGPTVGQAEIPMKEIGTHTDISNWLAEDAPAAEAEVRLCLAEDFGEKESAAFVNGDGVLSPRGFMADGLIQHSLNGHATNLSADALISLMYAVQAGYRNRGTWAMNGTTLATVRKLKDGQGNYLWQPSFQAGQPETILGRPVVEMPDMPNVESGAFPIAFGDFAGGYRIYDRLTGLSILSNPYLLATEGLVRIHARHRVGGDVVQTAALRKLKMATS